MEVYVFLQAGRHIGLLDTLLLCILTAVIGSFLVRKQGLETLLRGRASMMNGQLPVSEMFHGFCIVIAGALLITPGFVTDTIGFLLLIPPVRDLLRTYLSKHFDGVVETQTYRRRDDGVIEGEYRRVDEPDNGRDSG